MPEHFSTRLHLAYPDFGGGNWNGDVEANYALIDGLTTAGDLFVATAEVPSASLNVKVGAGVYRQASGAIASYAGTASFALTASATNALYLTDSGTLTTSTTGFPATGNIIRLALAVVGASTITSIADARAWALSLGGHVHWGVGTPTIAAGAGAGTGPTLAITGSDQAGVITVTTGTSTTASSVLATVTFGQAFSVAPRAVILTPAGANAAALSGAGKAYVDAAATATTTFALKAGTTALAASTTYTWHYLAIG